MAETNKKPVAKSGKAKKAAIKTTRQAKAAKRMASTQASAQPSTRPMMPPEE
ncbi:hypothetical protein ACIBHX_32350 [Nonomuraea sp. NPDC050536]|uniref:hypothetical protein n=1 Tax=Nonomuraea sp. NPDC050536 TaxID=3364366 RepID=UPI0037CB5609